MGTWLWGRTSTNQARSCCQWPWLWQYVPGGRHIFMQVPMQHTHQHFHWVPTLKSIFTHKINCQVLFTLCSLSMYWLQFPCKRNKMQKVWKHLLVTSTIVIPTLEREPTFVPAASTSEDLCHCQLVILCEQSKWSTCDCTHYHASSWHPDQPLTVYGIRIHRCVNVQANSVCGTNH